MEEVQSLPPYDSVSLHSEFPTMTPQRAQELIQQQLQFGSGYNRNAVRLILAEVQREHGQVLVDSLIRTLELDEKFDLAEGTDFSSLGK
jgi:hypothetical protein